MSERFPDVAWYCDECNEYLNGQTGFSDQNDSWKCTDCGHENNISSDAIMSDEQYEASMKRIMNEDGKYPW